MNYYNKTQYLWVGQKKTKHFKKSPWVLGTCDGHFSQLPNILQMKRSIEKKIGRLIDNETNRFTASKTISDTTTV